MRVLRKVVAFALYAALLMPGSDYRLNAWARAVEMVSTSLDKTMRRRKSRIEAERFAKSMRLLHEAGMDREEATLRIRA